MMNSAKPATGGTKSAVLTLLAESGGWVSGELLSDRLRVSRAAVAKHVSSLRREGNAIEGATRRGYRLVARVEPLRREGVAPLLATRVLGRGEWRCFHEISSTNTAGLVWAAEGAAEGAVVVADTQTRGRGRKGGEWRSTPRGLLCSIILRPECDAAALEGLARLTAEAVAEAVTRCFGLAARAKEPNDVFIGAKKCCGVLVELGLRAGEVDWAVVGIGCNLNALPEELPRGGGYSATSLLAETGAAVSAPSFFADLLLCLEKAWARGGLLSSLKQS